jgi:hypothetical protein
MKIWSKNLQKLKRFKAVYKHTNVPPKWDHDPVLATWVENIRSAKRKLPNDLLAELKELDFDFEYTSDSGWKGMYAHLKSFWKKYGHTNVPEDEQYKELHAWTINQRHARSQLPVTQIALLDELDFDWTTNNQKRNHWEFMFGELKKFKEKFGHTKVVTTDKENYKLALWVHNIRARSHQLDDGRKNRLTALGFLWQEDIKKQTEQQWLNQYHQLQEFKKQFGHCNVPIKWKPNKKLATWVSEQRLRRKNKGLIPEREKLLNKIGFSWSEDLTEQYDKHWNNMFLRLKKYKTNYGNMRVTTKRDKELKSWVWSQRVMIKQGMLPSDKTKKLESIDFILRDVRKNSWDKMYSEMQQYMEKFGTQPVPKAQYPGLSHWINAQRQSYTKGILSKERIKKLDKINFVWAFEQQEKAWTQMYNQLVDFKKKFKHTNVPTAIPEYKRLSSWIAKQRSNWRAKKISETQYRLLDALGFTLNTGLESDLKWQGMFTELSLFKKKFKHFKVPAKTYPTLARWVSKQKQKYKEGKLSKDRIKKIKGLGFDLNLRWKKEKN